jgi:hypothetical protein
MWWRKMESISWAKRVKNEELLWRVKEEKNILYKIKNILYTIKNILYTIKNILYTI